jgi:monofunctional biosynthetic peptidoglycan transglycosylase
MMIHLTLVLMVAVTALGAGGQETGEIMDSNERVVVEFGGSGSESWRAINDGVMGGLSQSGLTVTDSGVGVFAGHVSLENNGGFASVRTSLGETDLSAFEGLAVRVKGEGKRYRLRLRTDNRFDGVAYQATFETTRDEWQVVEIPFDRFVPTYRGRTLRDQPPLDTATICQLGLMIADKQAGRFRLEIEWVRAYKTPAAGNED